VAGYFGTLSDVASALRLFFVDDFETICQPTVIARQRHAAANAGSQY
jgi:hypothetical protein